MKQYIIGFAGLFTSAVLVGACLEAEQEVEPIVASVEAASSELEFSAWQGEITQSTSATFAEGMASSLLLHGPDARGRYTGEWRQLGCGSLTVVGRKLENGNLRLVGDAVQGVCHTAGAGGLACVLQLDDGSAEAQLDDGNSGDPQNPDCVSCADDRAAGCCAGTAECCVLCAPVGECGPETGGGDDGVGGDLGECGPDWPDD